MTLTLNGRIASKKNSKRIFRNRYTGKPVVTSSSAYETWHTLSSYQLNRFVPATPLVECLSITLRFNLKGKLDADVDNMMSSVVDLLQDMGFIENDKQIVEAHLYKSAGHSDFTTTINIVEAPSQLTEGASATSSVS